MGPHSREEQAALNQAAFRAANEKLNRRYLGGDESDDPYPFLCECGDRGCTRVVELTLEVYAEIRSHPARFLVLSGHVEPSVELEVEAAAAYSVVEKFGVAGEAAALRWPRSSR